MEGNKNNKIMLTRCFCVILALVCTIGLIVLSVHSCEKCECLLCALQISCKGIWQSGVVIAAIYGASLLTGCRTVEKKNSDSCTLVTLKVKLSD